MADRRAALPTVRSVRALVASGAALSALAVTAAPAPAATPTVSVSSGLTPAFSRSITDYVTRCPAGSVSVTTNSPRGTSVKVDGRTVKSGRVVTKVKLAAGQRFIVTSKVGSASVVHSIRCLPADFPSFSSTGRLPSSIDFVAMSLPRLAALGDKPVPYAWVVDSRGTPIWWKHVPGDGVMDVKPVPGRKIAFWHGDLVSDVDHMGRFSEYALNGVKSRELSIAPTDGLLDLHEALPLANGDYYIVADVERANVDVSALGGGRNETIFDNVIRRVDSKGNSIWVWNTADHIALGEALRWLPVLTNPSGVALLDAFHINSIEEDGQGGLILSFRHLDAIYRVDKATGAITWKLGGTATPRSLTVVGDDGNGGLPFMGQHDARVQSDGTITVYDNGSGFNMRRPRVTRWRIDAAAKTATLVEKFTDPDVPFSFAGGGARRMADGSWVVAWCHGPWVKAYDRSRRQVFALKFAGAGTTYRAAPITAAQMTRFDLVVGMDSQYPR